VPADGERQTLKPERRLVQLGLMVGLYPRKLVSVIPTEDAMLQQVSPGLTR
jgi:hypothetical protein